MNHHLNHSVKDGSKGRGKCSAKAILFILLALCMTFGLSSCGGTAKETKENQVKEDIAEALSKDAALSDYNLEVTSFSISKRQTNADDKTDFVWCEVAATGNVPQNPDHKFSCSIECEVTYGLYNDGWRLDTYTCDMVASSIKPLYYPTQEQVEKAAYSGGMRPQQVEIYDMIQKSDTEVVFPDDKYFLYRLPVDRPYTMEDMTLEKGEITYIFDLKQGWHQPR